MGKRQTTSQVARLFATGGRRTTRVAVEHELLTADIATGAAVELDRIRAATRGAWYAEHLAFEPGGQVELSLPPVAGPAHLGPQLEAAVAALGVDCASAGVRLVASPVDSRPESEIPLQLISNRYVAMQRHFDSIGPAGRRMMRRTASTQLCLDWWSGAAGLEQWRLLNLAGPFLAAAFAHSAGPTSRLATWLEVDPSRTAFDDRLVRGDDPVAAYADFAASATPFLDAADLDQHLSTLFPPVRPRGRYLEVRFLDVQLLREIEPLAATLSTLLYDDACRTQALRQLEDEVSRLGELWQRSAAGDAEVVARGRELVGLAASSELVGAA
jgi:gamma-glutamylcysteine synthetase